MKSNDALERAREAVSRKAWREAYESLSAARDEVQLEAAELESLGVAAYLVGDETAATDAWKSAHERLIEEGEVHRAARLGFWISFTQLLRGEIAQCKGWLAKTERLLGDKADACAEGGLTVCLKALLSMGGGNAEDALAGCEQAIRIANQFDDPDLLAFSLLGRGQALIQKGLVEEGAPLLDEAMVVVTEGGASPIVAGIVYCAVILTSQRIFDLGRAAEWTHALHRWCSAQNELVAFRAQCLIHRSEVLQLQGDWEAALADAQEACERALHNQGRLAGGAFYRRAEIHRLRGELDEAEAFYKEAGLKGREPQPGISLLRLEQGDIEAACAAMRRLREEAGNRQGPGDGTTRVEVLGSYVRVMLAAGNIDAAADAAEELKGIARKLDARPVSAIALQSNGMVLLRKGEAREALSELREAWMAWQDLQAPYEAATVRVLIAQACRAMKDTDTAESHEEAAARVFDRLGVVTTRAQRSTTASSTKLSGRELEVLRLVAKGLTNRKIASELFISEHTVARHVANIFNKIGVGSRAAATAYAAENELLD